MTVRSGDRSSLATALLLLLASSSCLVHVTTGAKVLLVTVQLSSHVIEKLALGEALVAGGHEVYIALSTTYPKRAAVERLGIKLMLYSMPEDVVVAATETFERTLADEIFSGVTFTQMGRRLSMEALRDCEYMMRDKAFIEQIRQEKFDIAVAEPFLLCPCTLVLPEHVGIPFVSLSWIYLSWEVRTPTLAPFLGFGKSMTPELAAGLTLWERVVNAIQFVRLHNLWLAFPGLRDTRLLGEYTPHVTSWSALIGRSQLFLILTDYRLAGHLTPLSNNMISVAGLTASPAKPLPDDLEEIFAASSGVILASFGSMAYYIPSAIVQKFFDAFSRLNQTVVARFAAPEGIKVPANVKLVSWLPQNDVLGHAKTRLFITHCGNNGQYEALYHGVPMIGFPLFAEQEGNSIRAADRGLSIHMDIFKFSAEELITNIYKILQGDIYKDNIKRVSEMWREEPMTPRDRATYWIEHVIKYGGRHLRSPALDISLYQFLMLDVMGVFLAMLLALGLGLVSAAKFFLSKCKLNEGMAEKKAQ